MSQTSASERKSQGMPPFVARYIQGIKDFNVSTGFETATIRTIHEPKLKIQPFLSVIMRTQGLRPFAIEQALTSLLAQDNQDFEVIICIHSEDSEDAVEKTKQVIDLFPESLSQRTSLINVAGGRRGVPMNVGISKAQGDYVAFLDDDDLVTGEWVSRFKKNADKNPNMVVRNRCVDRVVQKRSDEDFTPMLTQSNWVVSRANDFYFLESLERNSSPLHSYAIPREIISSYGTYVDPELDVAEDWDYLMRNAALCGVSNDSETTSIYNRWSNANSSMHLHDEEHWQKAHEYVVKRLVGLPVLVSGDEALVTQDVYAISHQLRELIYYLAHHGGMGKLLEQASELERFRSYAAMTRNQNQGYGSFKESLPKPVLDVLVILKSFLRKLFARRRMP